MPTLKDRIRAALANGSRSYHEVMHEVFPDEHFPRAFRCSSNGGPPGCAMTFGRALREMGITEYHGGRAGRGKLSLPPQRRGETSEQEA